MPIGIKRRRQGTEEEILDEAPSRGASYERDDNQSRMRSTAQQQQQRQQRQQEQQRQQQQQQQRSRFSQPPPL